MASEQRMPHTYARLVAELEAARRKEADLEAQLLEGDAAERAQP